MTPLIAFDVFDFQAVQNGNKLVKLEGRIDDNADANVYVQVFDSATTPADGEVPKKVWQVGSGVSFYKEFKVDEFDFQYGLYVCVSTTEATKTLGTGNNKFANIQVELQDPDFSSRFSFADDAGTTSHQVWPVAAGTKFLIQFTVRSLESGNRWVHLFASDNPTNGSRPIMKWGPYTQNQQAREGFGARGLSVGPGCKLCLSSTESTLTLAVGAGANWESKYADA